MQQLFQKKLSNSIGNVEVTDITKLTLEGHEQKQGPKWFDKGEITDWCCHLV